MTRLRIRPFLLAAAGAGLIWILFASSRAIGGLRGSEQEFERARPRKVFVLPEKGWLEFDLPPAGSLVRLSVYAEIDPQVAETIVPGYEDETELDFVVAYELVAGGDAIAAKEYHLRSRLRRYLDESREPPRPVPAGFYVETETKNLPLHLRSMRLPLSGEMAAAERLRLRFVSTDPRVAGATIRLHVRQETGRQGLPWRWFRLAPRDRERLAAFNVFPQEFLRESERDDLLRYEWTPLAPLGTRYRSRRLYLLDDDEDFTPVVLGAASWGAASDGVGELTEIEPGRVMRVYEIRPGRTLVYRVEHAAGEATPFRIDLRRSPRAGEALPAEARYELLGVGGELVASGVLRHPGELSAFDRLLGRSRTVDGRRMSFPLSEASRHYFRLGAKVRELRLSADRHELVAAAFNRPGGIERKFVVGYRDQAATPEAEGRSWYYLRPTEGRVSRPVGFRLIHQPRRPPAVDPRVAAGEYRWESLVPASGWRGHELFVPRREGAALRNEGLATSFREVEAGKAVDLEFGSPRAGVPIEPSLIFFRQVGRPFSLNLRLGDSTTKTRLAGRQGTVTLPRVAPGERMSLRIETDAEARWFVSHTLNPARVSHARRLAFQIRERVEIPFVKTSSEPDSLTVRFFQRTSSRRPASLSFEIPRLGRPVEGAAQDWTFDRRSYEIHPASETSTRVLGREDLELDGGQIFFLRLGSDLAPGRYVLRITPAAGTEGWAMVSRIFPGSYESHRLFKERGES